MRIEGITPDETLVRPARARAGLTRASSGVIPFAVLAIVALAAALRLVGINWDQGFAIHPDERRIVMAVADLHWPQPWDWGLVFSPRSPLNPRFFAYGSLPIYLLRLLMSVVGASRLYIAGRALAVACDLGTIVVVYRLGRELWGRGAGLAAAAFLAVSVLAIQLAHFLTVDSLLTLLVTLALWASMRVARGGRLGTGLLAGALTGLALATKTSALPLFFVALVAWAAWAVLSPGVPRLGRALGGLALTWLAAGVAFLLAEPYALIDWFRFGTSLATESAMAQGTMDYPYTRQYLGTAAYLYPLRQLLTWSLGWPLGLFAIVGTVWLTWRAVRTRRRELLVALAWIWPYFAITGAFRAKFVRYAAPLLPWLCLGAGLVLWEMWRSKAALGGSPTDQPSWPQRLALALGALVFLSSLGYALAFDSIYLHTHPWIEASRWIRANVPTGAALAAEVWDDPLPVGAGERAATYETVWLDNYAPDSPTKLRQLAEDLSRVDYVVLSSQRLYATIGRLPERYPLTAAYYRLLFAGKLGFELVHVSAVYPQLGPIAWVDEPLVGTSITARPELLAQAQQVAPFVVNMGRLDESATVYDHPRGLVFEKTQAMGMEQIMTLIQAEALR